MLVLWPLRIIERLTTSDSIANLPRLNSRLDVRTSRVRQWRTALPLNAIAFDYGTEESGHWQGLVGARQKERPRCDALSEARPSYSSSSPKILPVVGFTRWVRWQARQVIAL